MPLWIAFLSEKGGALDFEIPKDEEFTKYMNIAQSNGVQNMNFTELMKHCIVHYHEYGLDENTFNLKRENKISHVGGEI